MISKVGIRGRMILLTIVPTLTVSLLLSFYFLSMRFADLERNLSIRGEAILSELVASSEYALSQNDQAVLQNITDNIMGYPTVKMAAIYGVDGKLLSFSGQVPQLENKFFTERKSIASPKVIRLESDQSIQLISPVFASSINLRNMPDGSKAYYGYAHKVGWAVVTLSREDTVFSQYQAIIAALLIVLIGLTISILFGLRLAGELINPLFAIINAVKRIRDGKLDTHVSTDPPGEMKVLEEGINNMTHSIRHSHEEMEQNIKKATSDLRETLKTIEKQNLQLDAARNEAIEASQVKSKFLANMSHEIRTPMNAIMGFLELLGNSPLNETQAEYVRTTLQSSKHLLEIINDILDFSKIESGGLILEAHPFNIINTIENVAVLFRPAIINRKLEFALMIDNKVPEVVIGDELRFSQIITNLLSNALKFTPKGGVKLVVKRESYSKDEVGINVQVVDTGIGLTQKQMVNLFNAFTQADASTSRKYGGTGLGLTITQSLVEKMGGVIRINSELNEGSTFQFTLEFKKSDKHDIKEIGHKSSNTELKNKRIVVFDQTEFSARALIKSLESLCAEVIAVNTEENLIDYIAENSVIDCVIIAYTQENLPDAKKLYRSLIMDIQAFSQAKSLLFSNLNDNDLAEYVLNAKIDGFLGFPFRQERLVKALLFEEEVKASSLKAKEPKKQPIVLDKVYTVLAVDDNEINLRLLKLLLDKQKLIVYSALSAKEALDLISRYNFDLILTDLQMPEMDGVELCQALRNIERYKTIPIIAVTADVLDSNDERLVKAGFDEVAIKPINEAKISEMIAKFLQKTTYKTKENDMLHHSEQTDSYIDIEFGKSLAGGDEAFAREMIKAFMDALEQAWLEIKTSYDNKDKVVLKAAVHKLHGASSYCGLPKMKEALLTLEKALSNSDQVFSETAIQAYDVLNEIREKTILEYQEAYNK
ncbi:histidine kinase dimerization/phospho-acceptor domain-containing protein [Fangia hongkongensis]|uniref:histidine kinase dimerization/phospho-acceptor domain-containing protein n=3 Tax=Fangia hongkongensis TaxID=270495 RepID=UPI000366514D|nr:histidine kinase dimerization/phospho-acceptor domain-containing protein [Fangia hongkongensis]